MSTNNKTVVIAVCGSIAAYKICELTSLLKKAGVDVHVTMTANATKFVTPLTFETLSNNAVTIDDFAEKAVYDIEHISLAKKADLFVVAPATANFIGKYASGIADDFVTTTAMATRAPVLIAPAMNPAMLGSAAVTANIALLENRGVNFIYGCEGKLACGDVGRGRLVAIKVLYDKIISMLNIEHDYSGKKVVVTAGGTVEDIDRVRFIGNYSSGKMGFAIAQRAAARGAEVVLIAGRVNALSPIHPAIKIVTVKSTEDMFQAVKNEMNNADYIIKAAAPADYRVENPSVSKIKDESFTLKLTKNPDIAKYVGENKGKAKLAIFCAETESLLDGAREKLAKKHADMIIANDVTKEGAGFGTDTNIVTIIDNKGETSYDIMPKTAVADIILDRLL